MRGRGGRNPTFLTNPSPSKHTLNMIWGQGGAGRNIQLKHVKKQRNVKGKGIVKSTCGEDKTDEGTTAVSPKWKLLKLEEKDATVTLLHYSA